MRYGFKNNIIYITTQVDKYGHVRVLIHTLQNLYSKHGCVLLPLRCLCVYNKRDTFNKCSYFNFYVCGIHVTNTRYLRKVLHFSHRPVAHISMDVHYYYIPEKHT